MDCYWEINGKIVAKKAMVKAAENVLDNYGITIVDEDEEKISLFFDGRASYDMPEKLASIPRNQTKEIALYTHMARMTSRPRKTQWKKKERKNTVSVTR